MKKISKALYLIAMALIAGAVIYAGYHTRTYPAFGGEWLGAMAIMGVSVWAVAPGKGGAR